MNNVQQLSSTLMEICSQANANSNRSPTSSPGESIASSASGSISPSSSEFKMLCENLLHMVNKPVCASLNWKNAQQLLESSTHVKDSLVLYTSNYNST
ncbi:hypothetical protein GJ496_005015 [Pomphorhynchus laevis]|nr:hypothetical protein GJ496_005015 [Pomphorhynchus laevis]